MTFGAALGVHARLHTTRMYRGRLLWLAIGLLVLPIFGAGALLAAGEWGPALFENLVDVFLGFLVPFVPALLCAPVVSDEIENKTFTFVFARPAPRAAMVLAKWLVATVPAAVVGAVAMALCFVIALAKYPGDIPQNLGRLATAELALILGLMVFGALATVLGALFSRHPFIAFAAYFFLVEIGLGAVPSVVHMGSMSWHLKNLGANIPSLSPVISVAVVLAVASAALAWAALLVRGGEYKTDR